MTWVRDALIGAGALALELAWCCGLVFIAWVPAAAGDGLMALVRKLARR